MADETTSSDPAGTVQQINRAWLQGRVDDLGPLLHPDVVMVFPGFGGRSAGQKEFLAGFVDFCRQAKVHDFQQRDQQVDTIGDTAVVSFAYEIVYERSAQRYRATGRDLWVLARQDHAWLAIWRTMLDMTETPA